MQRLRFGAAWGAAVSPSGLKFVSLADLYGAWIRFLYALVEMQNALQNDQSIKDEQVTYDERRGRARSIAHINHSSCCRRTEPFLRESGQSDRGPALDHLWAITCGSYSRSSSTRAGCAKPVGAIESTPGARLRSRFDLAAACAHPARASTSRSWTRMTSVLARRRLALLDESSSRCGRAWRVYSTNSSSLMRSRAAKDSSTPACNAYPSSFRRLLHAPVSEQASTPGSAG